MVGLVNFGQAAQVAQALERNRQLIDEADWRARQRPLAEADARARLEGLGLANTAQGLANAHNEAMYPLRRQQLQGLVGHEQAMFPMQEQQASTTVATQQLGLTEAQNKYQDTQRVQRIDGALRALRFGDAQPLIDLARQDLDVIVTRGEDGKFYYARHGAEKPQLLGDGSMEYLGGLAYSLRDEQTYRETQAELAKQSREHQEKLEQTYAGEHAKWLYQEPDIEAVTLEHTDALGAKSESAYGVNKQTGQVQWTLPGQAPGPANDRLGLGPPGAPAPTKAASSAPANTPPAAPANTPPAAPSAPPRGLASVNTPGQAVAPVVDAVTAPVRTLTGLMTRDLSGKPPAAAADAGAATRQKALVALYQTVQQLQAQLQQVGSRDPAQAQTLQADIARLTARIHELATPASPR